jgi:adenylate cyclase
MEGIEFEGFDLLVSARNPEPPPDELLFVDFDNNAMQSWRVSQIPRDKLAAVIEKASAGGAELIGLDIFLDEKRSAEDDRTLTEAIGAAGNVVLATNFAVENLPAAEPLAEFREKALATGFVNLPVDSDGFLRRMYLGVRTTNFQGESFAVALASNYLQQPLRRVGPLKFRLGEIEIAVDASAPNTALIGAWSTEPVRDIPVLHLLAPDFDAGICKGKIVLIGQSSAKGKDTYPTPQFRFREARAGRAMLSGTEVHATAIASLLHGRTVRTFRWWQVVLLNYLLAALVLLVVVRQKFAVGLGAELAGLAAAYILARALFAGGVWLPFISTEAGILLALPGGLGYRYLEERRLKSQADAERRELMGLFGRYVSPEVAAEIWKRRGEITLAGQEMTATVLFSDIRNFTALTAGKPSAQVLGWLNDYFDAMSEVVRRNGGFLNKYIGDGILVLFGVPLAESSEHSASRAVGAALEMLERVAELNARRDGDRPHIEIGIGVHTGPLTAGSVGARDRLEYSVIGETVNLASRLEALTKEFKTPIVLSPETHALVKDRFKTRALGETVVRGFKGRIEVYTAQKTDA